MTTSTTDEYVLCNKEKKYFSQQSLAYKRELTDNINEARTYKTNDTATEGLHQYFGGKLTEMAIVQVERSITTVITKEPNFQSLDEIYKDQIKEFKPLNEAWKIDAEGMTEPEYKQWCRLKSILESNDFIEKIKQPGSNAKVWVFKKATTE